ncbi:MAG: hypothetical protein ACP5UH_00870 [Candidatus Micrarchaeia archaeon]
MRRRQLQTTARNDGNGKILLCSSFHVDAVLTTGLRQVRRKLAALPHLSITAEGSKLGYSIEGLENRAAMELERTGVTYRFYFEKPSMRAYIRNLLAFIAILGLLKDDYDIKLNSVHGYIAYALAESMQAAYDKAETSNEELVSRVMALDRINSSLAKALLGYQAEQKQMNIQIAVYKRFAYEVLSAATAHGAMGLLKSIGVEEEVIKSASSVLESKG